MKKIYKENQLLEVNNMPIEVIESIKVTIDIPKNGIMVEVQVCTLDAMS